VTCTPRSSASVSTRAVVLVAASLFVMALGCAGAVGGAAAAARDATLLEAARSEASVPGTTAATVVRLVDGDTLDVRMGAGVRRVRLLQVDTPEVYNGRECYGSEASARLAQLAPKGSAVRLDIDVRLDRVDRYGRLLRYVFRGSLNLNLWLVQVGAAAPWFYGGDRGRYATALLAAARAAKRAGVGLWGACPSAVFDPYHALETGPAGG
jgi:endonuclease YncB( thermonuclease family)